MNPKSERARADAGLTCPAPHDTEGALYPPRLDRLALDEALGTGAGPAYAAILETICGATDDSQPVEQYDGTLGVTTGFVAAHQRSVVQVQWNDNLAALYTNPGDVSGVRWGTGTLIAPDLMLTCGHLFDQDPNGWKVPRQNGSATAISPQDVALNMHVNVDYQVDGAGVLRPEVRFPITQLIEYRLGGLDMAICRIGGSPGATYGFTEVATADAAVGDMLAIIGHPAGQPKRIEAGPATTVSGGHISYNDIDTLGGNSGSGILQASTGRLVGVHTNGGCTANGGANSGTAIAAIRAVSPTLQTLTVDTGWRDGIITSLAADGLGTVLFREHGTHLGLDTSLARDLGTPLARDTSLARDQFDTGWRDVAGTIAAGDSPGTLQEGIVDPGDPLVDPVIVGPGVGPGLAPRPFVLAGAYQQISPAQSAFGAATPTLVAEPSGGLAEQLAEQLAAERASRDDLVAALHGIVAAVTAELLGARP